VRNGGLIPNKIALITETIGQNTKTIAQIMKRIASNTKRIAQIMKRIASNTKRIEQNTETIAQITETIGQNTETIAQSNRSSIRFNGQFISRCNGDSRGRLSAKAEASPTPTA
jgi:methyl-accepting chemotaxis protein